MDPDPQTIAGRKRCLACYYILDGLTESRCPECGRSFDLNDPTTYESGPNRRRPRRRTLILLGTVSLVSLAAILGFQEVRHSWVETSATQVCTECGARGGYRQIRVAGARVWQNRLPVGQTQISEFLEPHVGQHEHAWDLALTRQCDWWGRPVAPPTMHRADLWNIQLDHYPADALQKVARETPELVTMIRRDVLRQEDKSNALAASNVLKGMCASSDSRLKLLWWKYHWNKTRRWRGEPGIAYGIFAPGDTNSKGAEAAGG